jgi:hypothetical protein
VLEVLSRDLLIVGRARPLRRLRRRRSFFGFDFDGFATRGLAPVRVLEEEFEVVVLELCRRMAF